MRTQVTCSSCHQRFAAPASLANKQVACPGCQSAIAVPAASHVGSSDTASIVVSCQCGKRVKARAKFAGKRVACPACGDALRVPNPVNPAISDMDPLGEANDLGALGLNAGTPDLLGGTFDDMGMNDGYLAPTNLSASQTMSYAQLGAQAAPQPSKHADKHSGGKGTKLVTAAGIVAMVYGGYHVCAGLGQIVRQILLLAQLPLAQGGIALVTGLLVPTAVKLLFIALGGWVSFLGWQILQGNREALERAGQASMVYIVISTLGLLWSIYAVISLAGFIGPAYAGAILFWVIFGAVLNLIHVIPPAFILWVEYAGSSSK